MKAFKIIFYFFSSLVGVHSYLEGSDFIRKQMTHRVISRGSLFFYPLGTTTLWNNSGNFLTASKRWGSTLHRRKIQESIQASELGTIEVEKLIMCEKLLQQCTLLIQDIRESSVPNPVYITQNSDESSPDVGTIGHIEGKRQDSLTQVNEPSPKPISKKPAPNDRKYIEITERGNKIRTDFISKIISSAPGRINQEDLENILHLYAALVHRPKEGITKVLNGQTDTPKSAIYNDVVNYGLPKSLSLDSYRKAYQRLCKEVKQDVMQIIYQAAETIISGQSYLVDSLRGKKTTEIEDEDYISLIIEGSNPLYPIQPSEVKAIKELYVALRGRPRDGITKVLNYKTNTPKSAIYGEALVHIKQQGSDLSTYRDMYGRINKALNGGGMGIIYRMIDGKPHVGTEKQKSSSLAQAVEPQLEKQNHLSEESMPQPEVHMHKSLPPKMSHPILENSHEFSDDFLESEDGRYRISKKEQERLNRVYGLLPEHHGKSVTGVLSGATVNQNLPIWGAVLGAIEQIKKEASQEGDPTLIDINYFRKLHWSSMRITGKGGSKEKDHLKEAGDLISSDKTKSIKKTSNLKKKAK